MEGSSQWLHSGRLGGPHPLFTLPLGDRGSLRFTWLLPSTSRSARAQRATTTARSSVSPCLPASLPAYPATALTSRASIVSPPPPPSLPPASFFRLPCSLLLSYQHHFRSSGTQRAATPLFQSPSSLPREAVPSRAELSRAQPSRAGLIEGRAELG